MTGIEPRPQRWEARVLPLCHRGPPSQTLKELSAREIYMNGTLNTDLLPYELKQYCNNILDSELPVWYPEWTVLSVLIRYSDFTICMKI